MNERIQILAEEAGLCCDGTPDAWDMAAIERFAQLIEHDVLDQIVITSNAAGSVYMVSLMDEEHRILKILWEKP